MVAGDEDPTQDPTPGSHPASGVRLDPFVLLASLLIAIRRVGHPVAAAVPVAGDVSPVKPSAEPAVKPQASEDPAKPSVENQKWVVQLGAYKEAGNVKQLLSKLKELGLPAYTEKMTSDQGQRTRVRAGPFASRELAEKADAKIKKIGVVGKVTAK